MSNRAIYDLDQLVDIRDIVIDRAAPLEQRLAGFVRQVKTPNRFRVGDTVVTVSYARTNRTINDNFISMIADM